MDWYSTFDNFHSPPRFHQSSPGEHNASHMWSKERQPEHTAYPDDSSGQPESSATPWTRAHDQGPPAPASTKMGGPSPFAVPRPWQEAMAIVSVNAGLKPREILTQYYSQQPRQSHRHPDRTELDLAGARGVRAVAILCAGGAPGRIAAMHILVAGAPAAADDDADPVVRVVTNTSIRHVLGREPAANCRLWLRVAAAGGGGGPRARPWQVVPCCKAWLAALDFEQPLSAEEKHLPAVVDRLAAEVQRRGLLLEARARELAAKEALLQERSDELAERRRGCARGEGIVAASGGAAGMPQPTLDKLADIQQWQNWIYIGIIVLLIGALFCR